MSERTLILGGYGLTAADPAVRSRRSLTTPVSILLHSAGAVALVVAPLLAEDPNPEPQAAVRAFFAEPLSITAPPPPPPARAAAAARVQPKPQPQAQAFIAPVEVPQEITPDEAIDLGGVESGADGGVEGGVPGGVVGGIIGGLPDAPPPPVVPVRVGGSVREPKRLVSVPPVYPELAARARLAGAVIVEATIDERGRVVSTSVVQGIPMLTEAAVTAVKKWVYSPTLLNGVPTPVIMTVTVHFKLNAGPGA